MKLQIIALDPEDDQISTRDKLAWVKAPRAALVWPRRGRILNRRLDLALLQRAARRQGIQIGLVTFDPQVSAHARALNIPVFESMDYLPEEAWQKSLTEPVQPGNLRRRPLGPMLPPAAAATPALPLPELGPAARWAVFGLAVLAILALPAALLPRAEIALAPERLPQSVSLELLLDPELPAYAGGQRIPAAPITLRIAGERRSEATGRARVPQTAATGEVVFSSLSGESITLPAGSGVRASASGIRFVTLQQVTLEPGPGSTARASIRASQPGRSGNLPAGAIDAVEGSVGFMLSVSNPEATAGGSDAPAVVVSQSDRDRLRESLQAELLSQARVRLAEGLQAGQLLAPDSLRVVRTLQELFDHEAGEVASSLGLSLEIEVEALGYSRDDLEAAALDQLERETPPGHQPVADSLLLVRSEPASDLTVGYRAERLLVEQIDFSQVRLAARGRRATQAAAQLASRFDLPNAPLISRWPPWFPWLPWLPSNIQVRWIWERP